MSPDCVHPFLVDKDLHRQNKLCMTIQHKQEAMCQEIDLSYCTSVNLGTVECQLSELQSSEHVGQPNGLLIRVTKCGFHAARVSALTHKIFYLINAHVP